MASFHSQPSTINYLVLILIISFPPTILSQDPPPALTGPGCTSRLLQLTPCAPFVQGISPSPVQSCCDNLKDLAADQPGCLCLFLNNTALSAFPINNTLAMELPALCSIQIDASTCSGAPTLPPSSPASQVSLGGRSNSSTGTHTNSNSSVAASPVVEVAPRPIIMGLGPHQSISVMKKAEISSQFIVFILLFLQ